jgi:hypothetical protein
MSAAPNGSLQGTDVARGVGAYFMRGVHWFRRAHLAIALGAIGCASSPQHWAQFELNIAGSGCVSAVVSNSACDGGACDDGACDAGSTGAAYDPDTAVTLTAKPDPGWHFVSWTVTVYGSTHARSTVRSGESTFVVPDAGEQLEVFAAFAE